MVDEVLAQSVWDNALELARATKAGARMSDEDALAQVYPPYAQRLELLEAARIEGRLGGDYHVLLLQGAQLDALRALAPIVHAGEESGALPSDGRLDSLWSKLWAAHPLGIAGLRET